MLASWVHPELEFLSHQRLPMLFFHLEGRGLTEITLEDFSFLRHW